MTPNISPVALAFARQCVARGVRWLDRRAKSDSRFLGWRLQMMNIRGGKICSLVHMEYDTNGPLTLACKWDGNLAYPNGFVQVGAVMEHFGFNTRTGSRAAFLLGFDEGVPLDIQTILRSPIDLIEYCSALNQAWAEALGEYRTPERPFVSSKLRPRPRLLSRLCQGALAA